MYKQASVTRKTELINILFEGKFIFQHHDVCIYEAQQKLGTILQENIGFHLVNHNINIEARTILGDKLQA